MHKILLAFTFLLASLTGANAQQCNDNVNLFTQAQIDAFPSRNLSVINGSLYIQDSNGDITNLNALSSITRICGDLTVIRNSRLSSLAGLQNLTSVGGNLNLDSNGRLTDLSGLNNLQTVGGHVALLQSSNLQSLNGLGALRTIGGYFGTDNSNHQLPNLSGLNSLTHIGGALSINGANFVNLQGLNRIKTVGGGLFLDAVRSFAGLDSLTSINGELHIRFTSASDLAPISQLAGITSLTIQGNQNLSICHVTTVCRFLQNPNGRRYYIQGNGIGCQTEQAVLARCATVTSATSSAEAPASAVYPNPVRESIVNSIQAPYRIYDAYGRTLLQGRAATINVAGLPNGFYYIVRGNKVSKFIKE